MDYAFDPDLAPWVHMLPSSDLVDIIARRTELAGAAAALPGYQPPVPVEKRDVTVPGLAGEPDVPVRIYAPSGHGAALPGVLYLHGGGFVVGSIDVFDGDATRLAAEVGAVVVAVEFRLAPQHRFPAALDDCYAALLWAANSSAEIGIDPNRLAVYGLSAGAGLATALALLTRDRCGPPLAFQCLETPQIDDRLDTPSMRAYLDTPLWNLPAAEFSWDAYLGPGRRGGADVSPYAAPARAEDLSNLPAAFVTACQFDPLRDECIDYAQRLAQANVPTELVLYPGTFHGSALIQEAPIVKRMTANHVSALRRALHRP